MAQVNAASNTTTDGFPLVSGYDAGSGTVIPVAAGTISTDTNHNSQKYAPLQVQLTAGSTSVGTVVLGAGSALAGGVNLVDSAGTNKAGVDAYHNIYVTDGGQNATQVTASSAAAIKTAAGRLCKVIVTTVVTSAVSIYDNTNAASGTVLLAIPTTAVVGTIYSPQDLAANGIYVGGGTGSPQLLVTYD